jgi:hypothetical protein
MTMCNREAVVGSGWLNNWLHLGGIAALTIVLFAATPRANAQPAACTANCAILAVSDAEIPSGGTGSVAVNFTQGGAGAADETAAIAFTLQISDQLALADCTLGADGLPYSVVKSGALSNFKVVVENATCTAGRTHCLCDTGTPDNFINVVVYGPNPLPAPGSGPVEIPVIPSGQLMTINLRVDNGVAAGTNIPLRVLRETDGAKPQFQAYLSVGDKDAVDQTCVPQVGTPPCSGSATYQVGTDDGQVSVTPGVAACVGDCNGDGAVTVDEIVKMVNIALGGLDISECTAGDRDSSGTITVDEIVQAVNNALVGCPQ